MDARAKQGEEEEKKDAIKITPVLLSVRLFAVGDEHERAGDGWRARDRRRVRNALKILRHFANMNE